jgi:hypothetical protein
MTEVNDFNRRNIAEFRGDHGRLGGPFEGAPVLLLNTSGHEAARSASNLASGQADSCCPAFSAAGLFAPVELLIVDEAGGRSSLTCVKPSSLMVVEPNPDLLSAAKELDAKLTALAAKMTGGW